jgi:hypothetical protein
MSELMLPLVIWNIDTPNTDWKVYEDEVFLLLSNISNLKFDIKFKKYSVLIQIIEPSFNIDDIIIDNIIRKNTLSTWDWKFLTDKYSNFVIKDFLYNDVGLFVVIENAVFNEIVECHRKIHKNIFRQFIWCEMIQRCMRPNRLLKMAGLYGLDLTEYMELMGW